MGSASESFLLQSAVERQDWRAAVRHGEACLKAGEITADVHAYMALAHIRLDETDAALEHAASLLKLAPEDPACFSIIGEVYLKTGRLDEAQEILQDGLRIDPEHVHCRGNLCAVAIERADPRALADRIDDLAEVLDDHAEILRLEGILAQLLKQEAVAETCFRGVLRDAPEDFLAHFQLAQIYLLRGDARKAHEHAAVAAEVQPDNLHARNLASALAKSRYWVHRVWLRLSLWFVLPAYRIQVLGLVALLLFLSLRMPALTSLLGLYLILRLSAKWYLRGIFNALKAQEKKVVLSASY